MAGDEDAAKLRAQLGQLKLRRASITSASMKPKPGGLTGGRLRRASQAQADPARNAIVASNAFIDARVQGTRRSASPPMGHIRAGRSTSPLADPHLRSNDGDSESLPGCRASPKHPSASHRAGRVSPTSSVSSARSASSLVSRNNPRAFLGQAAAGRDHEQPETSQHPKRGRALSMSVLNRSKSPPLSGRQRLGDASNRNNAAAPSGSGMTPGHDRRRASAYAPPEIASDRLRWLLQDDTPIDEDEGEGESDDSNDPNVGRDANGRKLEAVNSRRMYSTLGVLKDRSHGLHMQARTLREKLTLENGRLAVSRASNDEDIGADTLFCLGVLEHGRRHLSAAISMYRRCLNVAPRHASALAFCAIAIISWRATKDAKAYSIDDSLADCFLDKNGKRERPSLEALIRQIRRELNGAAPMVSLETIRGDGVLGTDANGGEGEGARASGTAESKTGGTGHGDDGAPEEIIWNDFYAPEMLLDRALVKTRYHCDVLWAVGTLHAFRRRLLLAEAYFIVASGINPLHLGLLHARARLAMMQGDQAKARDLTGRCVFVLRARGHIVSPDADVQVDEALGRVDPAAKRHSGGKHCSAKMMTLRFAGRDYYIEHTPAQWNKSGRMAGADGGSAVALEGATVTIGEHDGDEISACAVVDRSAALCFHAAMKRVEALDAMAKGRAIDAADSLAAAADACTWALSMYKDDDCAKATLAWVDDVRRKVRADVHIMAGSQSGLQTVTGSGSPQRRRVGFSADGDNAWSFVAEKYCVMGLPRSAAFSVSDIPGPDGDSDGEDDGDGASGHTGTNGAHAPGRHGGHGHGHSHSAAAEVASEQELDLLVSRIRRGELDDSTLRPTVKLISPTNGLQHPRSEPLMVSFNTSGVQMGTRAEAIVTCDSTQVGDAIKTQKGRLEFPAGSIPPGAHVVEISLFSVRGERKRLATGMCVFSVIADQSEASVNATSE